ncbi:Rab effector MyRIP Exophilin-8 Myosin-VIIa- and Rab-interacting protein [Larimichthys crocea]|uniref:Rab effector MyRIP Exophilin-8 Myosin-VIIa-and Rab-interacting protein n=1 Tax=Larimichthys crocea TaxID=215358 RepID=A0A6G0IHL5_LARCR|nr:Rab effector MyRIP Exophilin-8 Myosin-VIIa- and Rab-interacting protein [Larimichthys crocea]
MTAEEPDEAGRKQTEVDDDEQEDRRGKTETTETKGEAAEGGRESKQTDEETKDDAEQSGTSFTNRVHCHRRRFKPITTEVLKVLNATEDLLQGADDRRLSTASLPPNTDTKKLDQQFSRLEENVYMAAGAVYGLEADLSDLEECARGISSTTSDMELSFLEEQVASAAAKVQQSELQISDISARIAALKNAGLDVDTQSRSTKSRTVPVMPVTLDSSRQLRRRLPAPPVKDQQTIKPGRL